MRINFFHFLTQSWNPFNKNTPYTYSVNALNIHDQVIFSVIVCNHAILLSFFSNSCWLTVTSRRTMCTALYSGPNPLLIFLGINHEKRFEESPSRTCMCLALFSWNTVVERTLGYWYRTCILTIVLSVINFMSILRHISYSYAILISCNKFWNHTSSLIFYLFFRGGG